MKWQAPAGGGKVLQVVSANYTTQTSNSTNVNADTGLTASITPSAATSKVLVLVTQGGCNKSNGNAANELLVDLLRGATSLAVGFGGYTNSTLTLGFGTISFAYLDSPATTSSTTYKTVFKNMNNSASVTVQNNGSTSSIVLLEIGA